jgi:hypothetical protein
MGVSFPTLGAGRLAAEAKNPRDMCQGTRQCNRDAATPGKRINSEGLEALLRIPDAAVHQHPKQQVRHRPLPPP